MATEAGIELQKITPREVSKTLNLTTKSPCALTLRDTFMDLLDPKQLYRVTDAQTPVLHPIFLSVAKKQPEMLVRLTLLKDATSQRFDLEGNIDSTITLLDILHESMPTILEISQRYPTDRMLRADVCNSRWIRITGIDAINNELEETYNEISTSNPEHSSELKLFTVGAINNKSDLNTATRWWIKSVQPTLLAKSEKHLPL